MAANKYEIVLNPCRKFNNKQLNLNLVIKRLRLIYGIKIDTMSIIEFTRYKM